MSADPTDALDRQLEALLMDDGPPPPPAPPPPAPPPPPQPRLEELFAEFEARLAEARAEMLTEFEERMRVHADRAIKRAATDAGNWIKAHYTNALNDTGR